MKKISTKGMDKETWLMARSDFIGGSDCAAALDLSPWSNPYDLWIEKSKKLFKDISSESMEWGTRLEEVIAKVFAEKNNKKIYNVNQMLISEKYPFMMAEIDRKIANEGAILECKTCDKFAAEQWSCGVPEHYYLQCMHYLAVTGYQKAYVAVLIGGNTYKQYEIERDNDKIEEIRYKERLFWDHVEKDIPPEITQKSEMVNLLYPDDNGETVELSDSESIGRYIEIRDKIKELKDEQDFMQTLVKAEMQEAETGIIGKYVVSWKKGKKNRTMRIKECAR